MEPIRDTSGIYYSKSDINLLQLRVSLREILTTQILQQPKVQESRAGINLPLVSSSDGTQNVNKELYEEVIIKWQEKILSTNETLIYERPKYKQGDKKLYHKLAIAKKKKTPTRIFTYLHTDEFKPQELPATTSTTSKLTENVLRNRFREMTITEQDKTLQADESLEENESSWFYIMADLIPRENLGDNTDDHVILCKLRFDGKSQIVADPDLNKKGQNPLKIEGLRKGNSIFEYKVELFTAKPEESPRIDKKLRNRESQLIDNFDRLPSDEMRVVYAGEITRCGNFFDTNGAIFIHYQLDLPQGWIEDDGCELSGISEACYQKWDIRKRTGHFSLPLYFSLKRKRGTMEWPSIIFSIFSKDWFTFDRDQGFAIFSLPEPGSNSETEFKIQTWRPAQTTPIDQLYRFFIGGAHLLRNTSYLNTQSQASLMSRHGLQTESSGYLELRLHSLLQTSLELQREVDIQEEEKSYFHPTTMAVIKAFHKSFMRLRAAKQQY